MKVTKFIFAIGMILSLLKVTESIGKKKDKCTIRVGMTANDYENATAFFSGANFGQTYVTVLVENYSKTKQFLPSIQTGKMLIQHDNEERKEPENDFIIKEKKESSEKEKERAFVMKTNFSSRKFEQMVPHECNAIVEGTNYDEKEGVLEIRLEPKQAAVNIEPSISSIV